MRNTAYLLMRVLLAATLALAVSLPASALAEVQAAPAGKKKPGKKKGKKPVKIKKSDLDGDGVPNKKDPDIDGDRTRNGADLNVDGDRKRNATDRDLDGDGKPNARDKDIDADGILNGDDRDTDADGLGNDVDRDIDSDGTFNRRDKDMDGDRLANVRDPDMDGDGIPNVTDPDMDGDGIPNLEDPDLDGDGTFNGKDNDVDGNGIDNASDPDTDGDGVPDVDDRDIDGDGKPNGEDNDTDGDGFNDFVDPDLDGDGVPNYIDNDSDGTGDDVTRLPEQVAARVPLNFFGLVADEIFWSSGAERPGVLAKAQSTGIATVRQLFDWSIIEKQPGVYDWSAYDHYLDDMTRAGLAVLPVLYHPPLFHSARPPGDTTHGTYPPKSNDTFAAFAAEAVRRYGPGGTFWAAHPELPQRPLRSWQIWNEPNLKVYWLPTVNPAAYTAMLRTVGAAIRSVDPGADIVSAGLPHSRAASLSIEDFVTGMYKAGAKGTFNTLAIHPYAGGADGVYSLVERFRRLLDANGDADKQIWITELGWATGGPAHPFNIGEGPQAELIKRVLATLVSRAAELKLRGLIYFNWRDLPPDPATGDRWGLHAGLFRRDGSEKPAFAAFHSALAKLNNGVRVRESPEDAR